MSTAADITLVAGPGFVLQRARAQASAPPLSPHFHGEYLLCAQLRGREACAIDGHLHHLRAGDLLLLNPEQIHTGHDATEGPIEYLSLYCDREWLEALARECGGQGAPTFRTPQVAALELLDDLQRLWSTCVADSQPPAHAPLAREEVALTLCRRVLRDFADLAEPRRHRSRRPPRSLRRVIDYLRATTGPTDLDTLAGIAGLSKFHFIRSFAAALGITPAAYVRTLRIGEAARALRRGASVDTAATVAGFTNLRAFGRVFRQHLGASPRRYAAITRPWIPTGSSTRT